ncbi:MAG: PHP domain-containing protein, partial [Anaerolineae bacterium]|nr:PHP domain-containing protein [Anaerolineae bacterium]
MDTKTDQLTHLHVHSTYTLLGATAKIEDLVARASRDGMTHLAITDTNALYGAVVFDRACRNASIKPIIGMTLLTAQPSDLANIVDTLPETGYLVLLARDPAGYRSLCRLASLLQSENRREHHSINGLSLNDLAAYQEGVICLTGGRRGWTERLLRQGHHRAAHRYLGRLAGIFEERTYLSLEIHTTQDIPLAHKLAKLGHFLGIPPVAVQPIYCIDAGHAKRLRLLAAMKHVCRVDEVPSSSVPGGGSESYITHWLDRSAVQQRYAQFPEALAQTQMIADQCGDTLPDQGLIWPRIELKQDISPESKLRSDAHIGLHKYYGPHPAPDIVKRLDRELQAIIQYGYTPLFLVVADIVRFAQKSDIPVSTRGSVANSLVAYCTGITTVDPIAHDLLFERFLSPARVDVPDIDLDFCSRRRDEVLAYIREKYREDHVASVATISTMQPRSAVRETAKAYGVSDQQVDKLLRMLPHGWHPDPRRRDKRTVADIVNELSDPFLKSVIEQAYQLVGQPHHLSIHPGAIIITPGSLTDYVPVYWATKGCWITQYDHHDVEALGLPKIDLLGIRALTVLADAAAAVRRRNKNKFKLDDIP